MHVNFEMTRRTYKNIRVKLTKLRVWSRNLCILKSKKQTEVIHFVTDQKFLFHEVNFILLN